MPKGYQWAPLICFFEIKTEDKNKSPLVVSSPTFDTSTLPTFPLVVQNLSISLPTLIVNVNKLNIAAGNTRNTCTNVKFREDRSGAIK